MFIVGLPSNAILLYFLFTAKVSVVENEEHDEDEEGDYQKKDADNLMMVIIM